MEIDCPICDRGFLNNYIYFNKDYWRDIEYKGTIKKCSNCESGVTYPFVKEEELSEFYEGIYEDYMGKKNNLLSRISNNFIIKRYEYQLKKSPWKVANLKNKNILEIGCGSGNLLNCLKDRNQVLGVDISSESIKSLNNLSIKNFQGTIESFCTNTNYKKEFDTIILHHSLEHLVNLDSTFKAIDTLLKEDGAIIIAVPYISNWQSKIFKRFWLPFDVPRHRFHFSEKGLNKLLERNEFQIEKSFKSTSALEFFGSIQYLIFKKCIARKNKAMIIAHALLFLATPFIWLLNKVSKSQDRIFIYAKRK